MSAGRMPRSGAHGKPQRGDAALVANAQPPRYIAETPLYAMNAQHHAPRLVTCMLTLILASACDRDVLSAVRVELEVCRDAHSGPCGSPVELGSLEAGALVALELGLYNAGSGVLVFNGAELVTGTGLTLGALPESVGAAAREAWASSLIAELGDTTVVIAVSSNDSDTPRLLFELHYVGEPCVDGATRPCGSDIGACVLGTQTCEGNVFATCEGAVGPEPESCNGADDNCDGAIDESVSCDDGVFCNGEEACVEGACGTVEYRACSSPALYPALNGDCTVGVCEEATRSCVARPHPSGTPCDDGSFCTSGETCVAGSCSGGAALDCTGFDDSCNLGSCDEAALRCVQVPRASCTCTPGVDRDFDTFDECSDCADRNGSVNPGAPERCNGIDDNCNGVADELFDGDSDGYTTCATAPEDRDCDDAVPTTHPGAAELCNDTSGGQTGNGRDDDCDGYVDEGCGPCVASDADGDGVSECGGDCAPADPARYPGAVEQCDGADNDCNTHTVDNCQISDGCNFDGDQDPANDPDVCEPSLLCACILNRQGACDYRCTSYCNGPETGVRGDLCAADETCSLTFLRSANVHGCATSLDPVGTALGGQDCNRNSDCRGGLCANATGGNKFCYDFCASDAYCRAAGTVCRIVRGEMDGHCWPAGRLGLGAGAVGSTCTSDAQCDHGLCALVGGARRCTEPCCADPDCPGGFTCTWTAEQLTTLYVTPYPGAATCANDSQCPTGQACYIPSSPPGQTVGTCMFKRTETSPMCVPDAAGQGSRRAGAACSVSADCASNFCAKDTGVCVEPCCDDRTCPLGLTCELQLVETSPAGSTTPARVCVNLSTEAVLERR